VHNNKCRASSNTQTASVTPAENLIAVTAAGYLMHLLKELIMYILYHFPFSQHSRRVVSLLEAANLPHQIRHVAMDKGEHLSASFIGINPNHQVPVFEDGNLRLFESNAILRYLCNAHELTDWYPLDVVQRGLTDQWLDWNQCRLAQPVIDIVMNKVFLGAAGDGAAIERGQRKLAELFPILEAGLTTSRFLLGNQPTIADLSLASNIFQLGFAEIKPTGKTAEWYGRMLDIPGFQKSLPQQ